MLNTEGLAAVKALANQELSDFVSAVGTGAGDKFNYAGLRYGKIILLMDADSDGYHISTLMLAFLFRHMPELDWVGGYPFALILMLLAAALPYLYFKWRKWL